MKHAVPDESMKRALFSDIHISVVGYFQNVSAWVGTMWDRYSGGLGQPAGIQPSLSASKPPPKTYGLAGTATNAEKLCVFPGSFPEPP